MNNRETYKQILEEQKTHKNSHQSHAKPIKDTKKKFLEGRYVARIHMTTATVKEALQTNYFSVQDRSVKLISVNQRAAPESTESPAITSHYGFTTNSKKYRRDFPKLDRLSQNTSETKPKHPNTLKISNASPQVSGYLTHKNRFNLLFTENATKQITEKKEPVRGCRNFR